MKTSIFDMTFTLPPMIEITQVEKEMPFGHSWDLGAHTCAWTGVFGAGFSCC